MTNPTTKQTSLMSRSTFLEGLASVEDPTRKAFLDLVFWTGCRVTEALTLYRHHLQWREARIWMDITHLKRTKQTDPFPAPRTPYLDTLERLKQADKLFPFSKRTAERLTRKAFPGYYPHFFRMNRITQLLIDGATIPEIQSVYGLTLVAINRYLARVSVKRVDQILQKEVETQ